MDKKIWYKYCVVPKCVNTTRKTPNKVFLRMPADPVMRRKWCRIMKRDDLSNKTSRYVCEDHFNLEEELENYMRYKIMGGNAILKKGVLPHKFDCQREHPKPERQTGKRRRRTQMVEEILRHPGPSTSQQDVLIPVQDALIPVQDALIPVQDALIPIQDALIPVQDVQIPVPDVLISVQDIQGLVRDAQETIVQEDVQHRTPTHQDKSVQVKLLSKFRSKGTSTSSPKVTTSCCSPIKALRHEPVSTTDRPKSVVVLPDLPLVYSPTYTHESLDPDYEEESDDPDFECDTFEQDDLNQYMRKGFMMLLERLPQLYLGIPEQMYHVLSILQEMGGVSLLNIMITLKKIRLDISYRLLGAHFGKSEASICRAFNKSLPVLAHMLRQLILWPSASDIRKRLPISFRARYRNVQSIIDCLEIQIERPTNPVHQALTWSEYKKCNTLKYLISCTPDGLVNFVSNGYGGRTSDTVIFEDSGYFNNVTSGMWVMADRGFKNITQTVEENGCVLVRPPSVSENTLPTAAEVKASKMIAALRIHVERVISRVREFHMLTMHSTIDHNLISHTDNIIIIVCGIINLQNALIKV